MDQNENPEQQNVSRKTEKTEDKLKNPELEDEGDFLTQTTEESDGGGCLQEKRPSLRATAIKF